MSASARRHGDGRPAPRRRTGDARPRDRRRAGKARITTSRAPDPVGPYPHARRVGHLLFLSGVGPREPGTNAIPGLTLDRRGRVLSRDFEAECRSVFRNVRVILEAAGARWEDIVDVTVFLTDMRANFAAFNRLYAEHFDQVRPARTTVEVGALPTPIAVELKVIAAPGEPPIPAVTAASRSC